MKYQDQIQYIITLLVIIPPAMNYSIDNYQNHMNGIKAAFGMLISLLALRPINQLFRFHLYQRVVFGISVAYICILTFLIYQNETEARVLFKHLDSSLGVQIDKSKHTYDDNCNDYSLQNILDNFDHYALCHFVGFILKALCMRDLLMLSIWSVLDEVIELTFSCVLSHLKECWWDQVIIDVLICNTGGMLIGWFILKKLGIAENDYFGRKDAKSIKDWKVWKSCRMFMFTNGTIFILTIQFLCSFFGMNGLSIPPRHWIPPSRLILWLNIGNLAWKETEIDNVTFFSKGRLAENVNGTAKYIAFMVLALEVFLSVKFMKGSDNLNRNPDWPMHWVALWAIYIIFFVVYFVILRIQWHYKMKKISKERDSRTLQLENELSQNEHSFGVALAQSYDKVNGKPKEE